MKKMELFNRRYLKKLAIITTHPIQYNAPFFKLLYERKNIAITVYYTWSQAIEEEKYDPDFKQEVKWDIPLLENYPWESVKNSSNNPGSSHYSGIVNRGLIQTVCNFNPDAILVYGWNFQSHLKLMRYFKGKIKILFRGDSTLLNEEGVLKSFIRKIVLHFVYKHIDFALYAGKANKAYFKFAGVKEKSLFFMPHAIDNTRFEADTIQPEKIITLKKNLNIPEENLLLLFSGKLSENKNIFQLCTIVAEMKDLPITLLVVGSGPLEQKLKEDFRETGSIHFSGFKNQVAMPLMYAISDVLVLPSKKINETWGLCINEAMAAGKAVIASDGCGAAEDLIKQGHNGYIFPSDDLGKLKEHIIYMIANRGIVKQMGAESKKIIKGYSFENDCKVVEKIMKNIS